MKKLLTITILLLATQKMYSQPDVLFVLPGETSLIASRVFNLFQEYYRGNCYWENASTVTRQTIDKNNYIVELKENTTQNGFTTLTVNTYFGYKRGMSSNNSFNSKFSQLANIKLNVIQLAFNLIKDLDPEYFEELREIFEELGKKE